VERDDWNNWNFGTFGTCVSLKRFERSIAIERLERLELATAYVKVVSTDFQEIDNLVGRVGSIKLSPSSAALVPVDPSSISNAVHAEETPGFDDTLLWRLLWRKRFRRRSQLRDDHRGSRRGTLTTPVLSLSGEPNEDQTSA
jgi:hypothetical protein